MDDCSNKRGRQAGGGHWSTGQTTPNSATVTEFGYSPVWTWA